MQDKLSTIEQAVGLVRDGDVVALQNMATQAAPMALVRELIRQDRRGLGLVVLVGGMAVDWLDGARYADTNGYTKSWSRGPCYWQFR